MNKDNDNSNNSNETIDKNIKRILMFKGINKIHDIINKEKQQQKSDKVHILVIIIAFLISLGLTYLITAAF